jgi:putative tryptophan/tyrosine transport system substrate-binding protein
MQRREFITLLGGGAAAASVAWPLTARGQQSKLPVIGFLSAREPPVCRSYLPSDIASGFCQGLNDAGFVEGRNVAIEYRWAGEHYGRLPALAAELVQQHVSVIAALGSVQVAAVAKAATSTIPIVFLIGSDPVEVGLVGSLNRPGGNLTGYAYLNVEVAAKRLELLHKIVPAAKSIALLVNPDNPAETDIQARELQAAVQVLGLRLRILNVMSPSEIEAAFASIRSEGIDALQIGVDSMYYRHHPQLIGLAARYAVPTVYPWREFTVAGGLMNYGALIRDAFRQVGVYTGQILKRRKARRNAGAAADQIGLRPQPQDRQSARARRAGDATRACR